MMDLRDLHPRPRYVVAGRTHPKVVSSEGEAYREMLAARTWAKGVAPSVTFDAAYRDLASLTRLVQDATVVVLPYDSQDQVTSGVLVDALAAGRPVVATAFPTPLNCSRVGRVSSSPTATPPPWAPRYATSSPNLGLARRWRAKRLVSLPPSGGRRLPASTPPSPTASSPMAPSSTRARRSPLR